MYLHKIVRTILVTVCCVLLTALRVNAQDTIKYRIIFIGDAGEIDPQQNNVLQNAANNIIAGKTTVMYLGDNIYPTGFGLPGSPGEEQTKQILRAQFTPMRSKGAPVYFVPGNHDWDRMGKDGLAKIKQQWSFLDAQHDSLLKLVPGNGCPDPYEIDMGDSMVVIAFDSEWFLFPHDKTNTDANCSCNSGKDVIEKMGELFYKNRYKVILLASHHPFQSYGHHGGYYSLKDHIFPLTAINKNLYIPMPVIGSLYPLLRSTFQSPEDIIHPTYKAMIKDIDDVFDGFPNLIHVAGHEHGLQLIKNSQLQVVSGAGAKNAFVKKGRYSLFGERMGGYVTADLLTNNNVRLTYYTTQSGITPAFSYLQQYTDLKKAEDSIAVIVTQQDSATVQANAGYDSVSGIHRTLFGENYRREWAAPTTLPVIKISVIKGGLTPLQRGGGHQSKSLRLKDKDGKEWVLRSVNKYPEILLPEQLRETFAKDIVTDAMSAQHPYSALIVPVIADAARVPHANPIIGLVVPDKALGIYEKIFANTVCLLEEREPAGKSDNSEKMNKELLNDNDNSFDSSLFLRARLLDLFIGDWDRHEDQWRWTYSDYGKGKRYMAVPRDRDQVFHVTQGLFPKIASRPWIAPLLHDFNGDIKQVDAFFTESNVLNKHFLNQFSHDEWMGITNDFVAAMTDSVLETALRRLPAASYKLRYVELLHKLQVRRTNLPAAMEEYYRFLNKIVDVQTSDKNELVLLTDAANNGLQLDIYKINKNGNVKDLLFSRAFSAGITKEVRLYIYKGEDSVVINDHSTIKLRIVAKKGYKGYNVIQSAKQVQLYGRQNDHNAFTGETTKLTMHLSNDSANTAYVPTNPYNKIVPVIDAGYNMDDGLLLGASVKFVNQGFRKLPYASMQQFSFLHAFSTNAFSFKFHSEWLKAAGNADIIVNAKALAPDNTQNFFGLGNNTVFNKTGNYKRFYRARFSIYQFDPALRWRSGKTSVFSIGPSLQFYMFDKEDNKGRFINNNTLIHSYDSATIANSKQFAGIIMNYTVDKRNNKLLPTSGAYLNIRVQGYTGLNSYSKSFAQLIHEVDLYRSLDRQSRIVIANRLGGGITVGKTAFYQSLFLGGQENLLGYRQYRFAGESVLYNNFEVRIKLAQVGSYILPGQFGIVGFYDAGKVWAAGYNSKTIHQGVGGGFYFAPAQMAVFQLVAGYSQEGWYPYFTFGFRF